MRLWDARSGRPRGQPLKGHTGSVNAVALGEVDGEPVVVSEALTDGAALGCAFRPAPGPAPGGPHRLG